MSEIIVVFELDNINDQRLEIIEQEITDRLESLPEMFSGIVDWYIDLEDGVETEDLI